MQDPQLREKVKKMLSEGYSDDEVMKFVREYKPIQDPQLDVQSDVIGGNRLGPPPPIPKGFSIKDQWTDPESGTNKFIDKASDPLSGDYFARSAKAAAERAMPEEEGWFKATGKGDTQDKLANISAMIRGGKRGIVEGVGTVMDNFTAPADLVAMLSGFGALGTAARGGIKVANALRRISQASSLPIAAHGAKTVFDPESTWGEKAFGVAEMAGGAAGTYFPKSAITGAAERGAKARLTKSVQDDSGSPPKRRSRLAIGETFESGGTTHVITGYDANGKPKTKIFNKDKPSPIKDELEDPNLNQGIGDPELAGSTPYKASPETTSKVDELFPGLKSGTKTEVSNLTDQLEKSLEKDKSKTKKTKMNYGVGKGETIDDYMKRTGVSKKLATRAFKAKAEADASYDSVMKLSSESKAPGSSKLSRIMKSLDDFGKGESGEADPEKAAETIRRFMRSWRRRDEMPDQVMRPIDDIPDAERGVGSRFPGDESTDLGSSRQPIDLNDATEDLTATYATPAGRGVSPEVAARIRQNARVSEEFDWPDFHEDGRSERMFTIADGPESLGPEANSHLTETTLRQRGIPIPERAGNEFVPDATSKLYRGGHIEHPGKESIWTRDGKPSRYFSSDRAQAEKFSNARNEPLHELDITNNELATYGQGNDVYNLPMDVARRSRRISGGDIIDAEVRPDAPRQIESPDLFGQEPLPPAGETKPSLFSRIRKAADDFAKDESGEFDPDAIDFGDLRNRIEEARRGGLLEKEDISYQGGMRPRGREYQEPTTRRANPNSVDNRWRERIDNMDTDELTVFLHTNRNLDSYSDEAGQAILDYASDALDRSAGYNIRDNVEPTRSHSGGEFGYQDRRVDPNDVPVWNRRDMDALDSEQQIRDYIFDYRERNTPEARAIVSYGQDLLDSRFADSTRFEDSASPWEQDIGRGKTLDEVDASKKTTGLERLGKIIGEDRAKAIAGDQPIQFDEKPYRPGNRKRLSKEDVKTWNNWGDTQIRDYVDTDASKPGLTFKEGDDIFPKRFAFEYRDSNGVGIGYLTSDMAGEGISTLAARSDLGLRRGKIAVEMLKQSFDRGIREPSSSTSSMTKNLIERVKKLASSESGEINVELIIDAVNKMINSVSDSRFGRAAGRFMKSADEFIRDETGSIDFGGRKERPVAVPPPPRSSTQIPKSASNVQSGKVSAFKRLPDKDALDPNVPIKDRKAVEYPKPGYVQEGWNLARGTMSVDLPFITSAAFRQASPLAWTRGWFNAWGDAARSFGSKEAARMIMSDIMGSEHFKPRYKPKYNTKGEIVEYKEMPSIAEEIGIKMTDVNHLTTREERIMSTLAEKLPFGWGKYNAASNRAYTVFLNSLRKSKLDDMMGQAKFIGAENDMLVGKQIADFINDATGRSSLKLKLGNKELNIESQAGRLANILWSPRLLASRIRMLNPQTYMGLDPMVRKERLMGLFRTVGTWWGFAGLASMMGAEVGLDPSSADFGKIRLGDTRIDAGAGFQQLLVFGARMLPENDIIGGKFTSSTTNKSTRYGEGYKARTRRTTAEEFAASKLHPMMKLAYDLLSVSSDRPVHLGDRLVQMALPLAMQDLLEMMQENPELAAIMAPLASAGLGSSTYGANNKFGEPVFTDSIEDFIGAEPESLRGTISSW